MKAMAMMAMIFVALAAHGSAMAQDNGGSNVSGTEKVCFLGPSAQTETGLVEALRNCKRGDILDLGWLRTSPALQLCDFTKAIIYHQSTSIVLACVYTGTRRPVHKVEAK